MAICNGMGLALKPCTSGQEQGMLLGSSTSSMSRGACSSRNYMPVHTRASELEAEQTARHRASHITHGLPVILQNGVQVHLHSWYASLLIADWKLHPLDFMRRAAPCACGWPPRRAARAAAGRARRSSKPASGARSSPPSS